MCHFFTQVMVLSGIDNLVHVGIVVLNDGWMVEVFDLFFVLRMIGRMDVMGGRGLIWWVKWE